MNSLVFAAVLCSVVAVTLACNCGQLCQCIDRIEKKCDKQIFGDYPMTAQEEKEMTDEFDKFDQCLMSNGIAYDCKKPTSQCNARRRKRNISIRRKRQTDSEWDAMDKQFEDCLFGANGLDKCYEIDSKCAGDYNANPTAYEKRMEAAEKACEAQMGWQ